MAITLNLDSISKEISYLSDPKMDQAVAGVYIGCNETETEKVQQVLAECKPLPNPAHIGFSGWHNFDIIVQRKSVRGILCDFNPNTKKFLEVSLIACARFDRETFIVGMRNYVSSHLSQFSPNVKGDDFILPDEEIELESTREGSWLSTDEGYSYIKTLALSGKICVITQDIRNETVFKNIARTLKYNNIAIDTLYVSNIRKYMISREDQSAYDTTIGHLLTHETKLIHCPVDLRQMVMFVVEFAINELSLKVHSVPKVQSEDQEQYPSKSPEKELSAEEV